MLPGTPRPVLCALLVAVLGTAAPARPPSPLHLPRAQTLYTSGTMYAPPSNFNPLDANGGFGGALGCPGAGCQPAGRGAGRWQGPYATGTMGLLYEPLFLYDPVHRRYVPWLATSGYWRGSSYVVHVRRGVEWSDGEPLTGADVAYTVNLARANPEVPWRQLAYLGLEGAHASGETVTVDFARPPPYAAWQRYLWTAPVLPEHIWSKLTPSDQVVEPNLHPVGSGPMLVAYRSPEEVAYRLNPRWWGARQLGLSFRFKYLVDQVTSAPGVELTKLLSGDIDLSNAFLPGAANVLSSRGGAGEYNITAYYQSPPYMLPASTAWLVPNTQVAPMDNLDFRRALAWAVGPKAIVAEIYSGAAAMSPTGLPPGMGAYLSKAALAKYGFGHDLARARRYLGKSGYRGGPLSLVLPAGPADLSAAAKVVSGELASIGVRLRVVYEGYSDWERALAEGTFDLTIAGEGALDADPWSYFDRVFAQPVGGAGDEQAAGLDLERYRDPRAWALVKEAGSAPPGARQLKSTYGQLEQELLQDLPVVPLWYGMAWAQANTTWWSGFPSATATKDGYTPVMWTGWLGEATTVLALANLRPAKR